MFGPGEELDERDLITVAEMVNMLSVFVVCRFQGGVKVLITGPWQEASSDYSCLFDQITVPASLIQPGVLRCYCPGTTHKPTHNASLHLPKSG